MTAPQRHEERRVSSLCPHRVSAVHFAFLATLVPTIPNCSALVPRPCLGTHCPAAPPRCARFRSPSSLICRCRSRRSAVVLDVCLLCTASPRSHRHRLSRSAHCPGGQVRRPETPRSGQENPRVVDRSRPAPAVCVHELADQRQRSSRFRPRTKMACEVYRAPARIRTTVV